MKRSHLLIACRLAVAAASMCATPAIAQMQAAKTVAPWAEVASPATPQREVAGVPVYRKEFLSPVFRVDQIFKSMEGPTATESVLLLASPQAPPELLWITGYDAIITGPDGASSQSPEFMCHSNIDTPGSAYQKSFSSALSLVGDRLFSLDQGTQSVSMPDGFGIPISSRHPIFLTTQVLNHNLPDVNLDVRQRVSIEFTRHADLEKPLIPLVQHSAFGMVLMEGDDGYFGVAPGDASAETHGPGCGLGGDAGDERGIVTDSYGRRFSSFWLVEPGRHVYHTPVTEMLDLPYDTTAHVMSAHLHPYAVSIELYDVTAKKTVHKLMARQTEGKIGLADVDTFVSADGLPLYADHEYELITVYDNTSGVQQDSMATLFMYLQVRDIEFHTRADKPRGRLWNRKRVSGL